ncbi:MAG TPA: TRAP transporter small permease [Woeseiaceae bacterium]|nr:TRAP transporter small permease [Woeseiaceae bacterium]
MLGRIDRAFRALLAALMAAMVLSVTWQVVSRYVLGSPSSWTEELSRFLLIWIGLLGGSYAYHVKMHLGLDLLARKLPPGARRIQSRFIHVTVIFFAVTALIGGGLRLIWLVWELRQHSAALGVPMALVYCSLPISGLMLVLYAGIALSDTPASPPPDGV